ncbi:MAG: type III-B CRISPR module-associated protein Cmr3 [Phaeodactylibacter sp.]|uniref:type III-B CRISPR module-associated protein Cmr3 n=1 Tax=Phaeodactylibacter sp. TaxID=1940289 RepID=UPI0032EFD877
MATGYLQITPFDGLFFGKGRPFSIGDESWTEAELLPPPGVVWGALFSQLWYRDNNTPLDALKIGRIMLLGENVTQCYLPAPLDIFIEDEVRRHHHNFYWQDDHGFLTKREEQNVLLKPLTDEKVELPEGYLLSVGSLEAYMGAHEDFNTLELSNVQEIVGQEFKIGIGRDAHRRTAEEGKLYTVHFSHLQPGYCLLVEAEYPDDYPDSGILKLGGEGKMAHFEKVEAQTAADVKAVLAPRLPEGKSDFFKLYLTSPAYLDKQGHPVFLGNKPFRVEGGVTGKPYLLGGFDYKQRRPKPMHYVAPAGSVYILEYKGNAGPISTQQAQSELGYGEYSRGYNQFEIIPYYGDKG